MTDIAAKLERIGKLDPRLALWIGQQIKDGDTEERVFERLRHAITEVERQS